MVPRPVFNGLLVIEGIPALLPVVPQPFACGAEGVLKKKKKNPPGLFSPPLNLRKSMTNESVSCSFFNDLSVAIYNDMYIMGPGTVTFLS